MHPMYLSIYLFIYLPSISLVLQTRTISQARCFWELETVPPAHDLQVGWSSLNSNSLFCQVYLDAADRWVLWLPY